FVKHGAQKIHLVDLNAAIHSDPTTNAQIIDRLLREEGKSMDFEVAGGIRDVSLAKSLVERGAISIVIGSIAYSAPEVAREILSSLGSSKIILALDYNIAGFVKTAGWSKAETEKVESALQRFSGMGFRQFLVTSINRDGLLSGPDLEKLVELRRIAASNLKIIASGGVSSEEDLSNLRKIGIEEVVVGKALYENTVPLSILSARN
ncbi:MAG: HisA/HisF-related TIM barrel protein, partial [Nitrososphaerales archaeon]